MLALIDAMDRSRYSPRWYIAAKTDSMSLNRAMAAEAAAEQQQAKVTSICLSFLFNEITRADDFERCHKS
jgi:hypothetical protein